MALFVIVGWKFPEGRAVNIDNYSQIFLPVCPAASLLECTAGDEQSPTESERT
jgi:hypothetical protein